MVNTIQSSSTAMSLYDGLHELYKRSEVTIKYINDTERALMSVHLTYTKVEESVIL